MEKKETIKKNNNVLNFFLTEQCLNYLPLDMEFTLYCFGASTILNILLPLVSDSVSHRQLSRESILRLFVISMSTTRCIHRLSKC